MGNSRASLRRRSWKRIGVLGAVMVLLVAAVALFGAGPRRALRRASAVPESAQRASSPSLSLRPLALRPEMKSAARSRAKAADLLSGLPMIFEPNQGQADARVKFMANGPGYGLLLDESGAVLAVQAGKSSSASSSFSSSSSSFGKSAGINVEAVRMKLVGANPAAALAGNEPLPGKSNYFIGNDPRKWHRGVPQFAGVRYQGVYPGIDLVFYGSRSSDHQGQLEYDFKVAPGADPKQAELQLDGAGALELSGGDLVLRGSGAGVRLKAPRIYQNVAGKQQSVDGRFELRAANRVGFAIGGYDRSRELVIDPIISYSTYFGGSGSDTSPSIAVNAAGDIYLAGSTTSPNLLTLYPYASGYQQTLAGAQNVFVVELDPTAGTGGVLALTYLGGTGTDTAAGMAVDNGGNVYVAGTTTSTNFPTASGYQSGPLTGSTGTSHVFVSKLNPTLSALPYSTYLSGNGTDVASAMAIDAKSDVYVTGTTTSTNVASGGSSPVVFPASYLPIPFQQSSQGAIQFFVTEVNTSLPGVQSIPYSTYFGGSNGTVAIGGGIAVDSTNNVYFSGTTNFFNSGEGTNGVGSQQTGDFPILNAYQPCLDTPPPSTLTYPVTCTEPASPVPTDAFVAKLYPTAAEQGGAQLLFSTYFGGGSDGTAGDGSGNDTSTALAIDSGAASVYITGSTNSSNFLLPTDSGAFQLCLDSPGVTTLPCPAITGTPVATDAYVAKFTNPSEAAGTATTQVTLSYFSYLGGSGTDSGSAIAVDAAGDALVTGSTNSSGGATTAFPTTVGAIQTVLNGTQNAFFSRLYTAAVSGTNTVASYSTYFGGNGTDNGTSVTLDTNQNSYFAGDTNSTNLQVQGPVQPGLNGARNAFAVKLTPVADLCIQCIPVTYSPSSQVVGAGNPITVTFTLTNQGPDLATNVAITGTVTTGVSLSTASVGAAGTCGAASGLAAVCTIPSLQSGSTATVAFTATPSAAGSFSVTANVTATGATSTIVTNQANFTVTAYTVGVSPSARTVSAGDTAAFTVSVNPIGTYGNSVTLSCAGQIPVGASCGFNPTTLNFNGVGAQTSTLSLTTTVRPVVTISSLRWRGPFYAFWLMAPMGLMGLRKRGAGKKQRRRLPGWLALVAMFGLVLFLPACSKGKTQPTTSGTPAGTYPITVTATSGSYTQSYGITLQVQ